MFITLTRDALRHYYDGGKASILARDCVNLIGLAAKTGATKDFENLVWVSQAVER
jgi:hypothetical protein